MVVESWLPTGTAGPWLGHHIGWCHWSDTNQPVCWQSRNQSEVPPARHPISVCWSLHRSRLVVTSHIKCCAWEVWSILSGRLTTVSLLVHRKYRSKPSGGSTEQRSQQCGGQAALRVSRGIASACCNPLPLMFGMYACNHLVIKAKHKQLGLIRFACT